MRVRALVLAAVAAAALSIEALGAVSVEAPRLASVPEAVAAAPVEAAALSVSLPDAIAPSGTPALPAAAAPTAADLAYRAAVDEAKAELDALFVGRGPAPSPAPETLAERLVHPLAYRPSAFWRSSGWVEKTRRGWRLLVPGAAPVAVARWSAEGNPVVLLRLRGDGVLFRPTQNVLPALDKYRDYVQRGRLTRLTRRKPIRAFYDPKASPPDVVVKDGHHRVHVASRSGQAVYVELMGVRRPFEWEMREGRWGHPLF